MITKAIVEEVLSPYQVKVRIPILDRVESSPISTSSENLNTATICSLPNCYINVQVGDIVFVGFEDKTYYKAVVLGHLCRQSMSETYADVTFGNVSIKGCAQLPPNTSIGEVSEQEIYSLLGARENLQKQIDVLTQKVDNLSQSINKEVSS